MTWPEADVRTEATLELTLGCVAYHVVVELIAEELGAGRRAAPFRRERRFERTIPRHLA